MKFLKLIILSLIILLNSALVYAEDVSVVTLDLKEEPLPSEISEMSFEEKSIKFLEMAKHFDSEYPGDAIYTDFTEDVAAKMPALTRQEVYDYKEYIRTGLSAYRWVKSLYEKYKEALLVPKSPPIIVEDDQYDITSPQKEYIPTDEAVVIEDFKKIVSYSKNPRDVEATRARIKSSKFVTKKENTFDELSYVISKIELRKLFFYDILYDSPITGMNGIGDWDIKDNIKLRIISEQSGIKDIETINGLIHIILPPNRYIIANNAKSRQKPSFNFDQSTNLADYQYQMPLPSRIVANNNDDWTVYAKEVAIPINFNIKDNTNIIDIKAKIIMQVCNEKLECKLEEFNPTLNLTPEDNRNSSVATYIQMINSSPFEQENNDIKLQSVAIEQITNFGEALKISIDNKENINSFDLFVDNNDNIDFQRPRISIDGSKATVRILPQEQDTSLQGKDFHITTIINNKYKLNKEVKAQDIINASPNDSNLSWGLVLFGIIGGFLLNLMPCVFPVLSIKLLSLTKFGARNSSVAKKNFYYTLLGIFTAFAIIAIVLSLLKYIGHSLGWGMQFQSPIFLSIMIFAILIFILQVLEVVEIKTPNFINKIMGNSNHESFLHFLTGVFIVLMATPCTAPYLGTAVGFALAGSITDIFVILTAIAIGLSLPYILLYIFPILIIFIPQPGAWMQKLNRLMLIMLFLTLAWLFTIFLTQSGIWFCIRLFFYSLLFVSAIWLNNLNKEEEYDDIFEAKKEKVRNKISHLLNIIAISIFIIAIADSYFSYQKYQKITLSQKEQELQQSQIEKYINQDRKTVLVTIGADWCLTCKYNNATVFKNPSFIEKIKNKGIKIINIDWTTHNPQTLQFMEKYGRSGLPFYIIFSPIVPDGIVLPEILTEQELSRIIDNISL